MLQEIQAVDNALRKNTLGGHGVSAVYFHSEYFLCVWIVVLWGQREKRETYLKIVKYGKKTQNPK